MILMNDFRAEPPELIRQEVAAVERVIKSGWYILGNEVKDFESAWASCCGVDYAIGVGNGMDAIEIGLRALSIGTGDEVITTPMTAFATVLAIIRAGATPVLADIDPATALLDPASVKRCLSSRTRAMLLVHLYGQVRNMDTWIALCKHADIHLLEDCAQSHSASWKGKVAGSFGDCGAYSFYPTKNLGTMGDGGAIITNSEELANKARVLRNYGQSQRYHHAELGLNSRLDEMHAAILSARLRWFDFFTARRKGIAKAYFNGIKNSLIQLMAEPSDSESHVYHLFVILCKERERLGSYLRECGVDNLVHYPIPVHHQVPCRNIRRDPKGLIHAETHAARCLSIPCHPQMIDEEVNKVIKVINDFK
ncbi:dTDP-3-amino-3,6-dideoxy-alpha-D-galactopyranose transaminase [Candidatus Brocadiaceae bacterium B188]|nr:DegT/DnrJ/EryC1/StrS family aminotransferase [Candidatus Brocadia sapporoensis]QQR66104.1 MAG: DegT/DnrJ/EryC1/StrS family aminotransferase [Candidatus Brocadia sp.]TWU53023.1 dTDP-3-amino-3,6-dideoxy-alpha-D-galactopyranose transaminase [Candidatus Brocadiaceae bacterium B188]